ncbi:diguanylate cyclase [Piscinibacter sp.]|uniref:tetratricopeptide repeat-containing diguanylate cyclase n=1 Tax=Piscinibacter sp. TaxID=1903157 RepID=UPI0039E5AF76
MTTPGAIPLRHGPAAPWLAGLLLAGLLALSPMAWAASDVGAATQPFDALYAEITGPASLDLRHDVTAAKVERLRALLPAGDALRDARFRSVDCGSKRWSDNERALAYSREALTLAQAVNDVPAQGRGLICITAYVLPLQGPKQALVEIDKAVALLESAQQPQLLGEALMVRGSLLSRVGEQAKALLDYQRARTAFRDAGIDHEVDALLLRLATTYRRIGDWSHAEQYFNESMARTQARQDWQGVAGILIQLGHLHAEAESPDKAQAAFERAVEVAGEHGHGDRAAYARLGLASAQVAQGRHGTALATLEQARAGFAAAGITQNEGMLRLLTGQALAGQGRHQQALTIYRQALPLMQREGNERYLAWTYQSMAASEEALGRSAAALDDFKRYSELQAGLQRRMQLEQNRLLASEHELRTRELENRQLRVEAEAQRRHVAALERARAWQTAALVLGALLIVVLAALALRQQRRSRHLRTLAMTDQLTGVANRRVIERIVDTALARAARTGAPLALLVLDLDHFKTINDRYGHATGDAVLRAATAAWKAHLRGDDALGRFGGEEFMMVCTGASNALARTIAERLLNATRAVRLPDVAPELRISTSIGIAEAQPGDTRDSLFARADAALYRAKALGRDRVES